ncbi:serine proteinase stubble-like [Tachypleus tridentatus]|uniref:serine proteinase stubble-like n=1 Tax=Tachypleus tridentatus TaxID=6853 RepID=UPI003FD34A17
MGEHDFSSVMEPYSFVERGVRRKVVHPSYNFFTYENDLALVELEAPVKYRPHIAPICLPSNEDFLIGRNASITGWGRLKEGGVLPSILQEVQVPIISNHKCKIMFLAAGRREYIPDIFMCSGLEEGRKDSCQGDSGGPVQVQGEDGRWFLAGIISWGIGCGEPNLPGVCTRISKYKTWILKNIK